MSSDWNLQPSVGKRQPRTFYL